MEKPLYIGEVKRKFYKSNQGVIMNDQFEEVVPLYLENFQLESKECYDFLQQIATPKSYQELIQQFEISSTSLYSATIIGLDSETITQRLMYFNKEEILSEQVIQFIEKFCKQFGKCLLVLQNQTYFLESQEKKVLQYYESLQSLQGCFNGEIYQIIQGGKSENQKIEQLESLQEIIDFFEQENDKEKVIKKLFRLQIFSDKLTQVLISRDNQLNKYKYMLSQQYEYKSDMSNFLEIFLKPQIRVWPYQESCIQRIFVDQRAKSGIIVLPCGAGKTLVGILCICQIQKRTLILCINNLNVKQWQKQILNFTNIPQQNIILFTSETAKQAEQIDLNKPCVLITTYTLLSRKDELKSQSSQQFMQKISQQQWGLLLLDEVQVAPADVFKEAFLIKTKSHCKIGLTATLIREDTKIEDLQFYIGPKLFEESWINLTNKGFLAKVQCIDIICEMEQEYMKSYQQDVKNMKTFLHQANPNKFYMLKYLLEIHQQKKDKILVFIDAVDLLVDYAKALQQPYISGDVSEYEWEQIINLFKHTKDWNVLFISRVGDVGIDLPDANIAIELSSLFGSWRQKTQRLGRIIRPKGQKEGEFHAYFYSLISANTEDVYFSSKRQKYLAKQGYKFETVYQSQINLQKYIDEQSQEYFKNLLNRLKGKKQEQINPKKADILQIQNDIEIFMDFEQ